MIWSGGGKGRERRLRGGRRVEGGGAAVDWWSVWVGCVCAAEVGSMAPVTASCSSLWWLPEEEKDDDDSSSSS